MNHILTTFAVAFQTTITDIYFAVFLFFITIGFLAAGIAIIYQVWFGLTVGLAIYIMAEALLSAQYTTTGVPLLPSALSGFLIGSSFYLIPILALLSPLNQAVIPPMANNAIVRTVKLMTMGFGMMLFIIALLIAMIEGASIFEGTDTIFSLVRNTLWYNELMNGSDIALWIAERAHGIIAAAVGYMVFIFFFEDIIWSIIVNLTTHLFSRRNGGGGEKPAEAAHKEEDAHGHDDHHDDHHGH